MHIDRVSVSNFRLLREVELHLESRTTVIVGRNNSGKTSLTELFRRLLSDKPPSFNLEDFSLCVHEGFWTAFVLKSKGCEENEVRSALPFIEVKITVSYEADAPSLGPLSDFIVDLDPKCTEALIIIRYQLADGEISTLFDGITLNPGESEAQQKSQLCRAIRERIPRLYIACVSASDPNDPTNQKAMEWARLRSLICGGFINAQRGLDDTTHRESDVLGRILENLLNTAMSDSADPEDRDIAQKLQDAVKAIQAGIDGEFNEQLSNLLPAFSLFGYPGLGDPGLRTETILDVQRLLANYTKVQYAGVNGINLPEAYNGLGARNLIFILLKLMEFFKSFMALQAAPGIHLVFIEEPEVHLHPQMQEVFITKIGDIVDVFAKKFKRDAPWPVQFVVTTHSSHVANRAPFEAMRYFLATSDHPAENLRSTQVKDLSKGLGGAPTEDQEFLHKYMTLTRCDLLFADKAVLIEGITERLLLPKMVEKVERDGANQGSLLSSQYISVVEVGGAYAHLFFRLLEFLDLRTLIITDLDPAKKNDAQRLMACKVSEGTHTTNGSIKDWFKQPDITPTDLLQKSEDDKIHGLCCLAYQVPEAKEAPCGHSFEEAFILANPELFPLIGGTSLERENEAWEMAATEKKSDFALKHAIEETNWNVPRYIAEGLRWLATGTHVPSSPVVVASGEAQPSPVKVDESHV